VEAGGNSRNQLWERNKGQAFTVIKALDYRKKSLQSFNWGGGGNIIN